MKVLVIGRGGREHSIALKFKEASSVSKIYVAPGNAGISSIATCVPIDELAITELIEFAKEKAIDLTIVGPEAALIEGIADAFTAAGLSIFAPTKAAAIIEGSKDFAKSLMKKYDIPTADYATFVDIEAAKSYIKSQGAPIVVKADGLAAGKGVVVAETEAEAIAAVEDMLVSKAFAEAGASVVIEECLEGKEFSLMSLVHNGRVYPLATARDHKRAFDDDAGPNTGGMGAYAPVDDVPEAALDFAITQIVQKTVDGMIAEGRSFTGILYTGLMMTEAGPKVIEYNARFGDPETQVILPLLENDFADVLQRILNDEVVELTWKPGYCVGVVVASAGYPGDYDKGAAIPEIALNDKGYVVHAGTEFKDNVLVANGGRVLLVGAEDIDFVKARESVYEMLQAFEGNARFYYRTDIGK